ncbi:MAG: hypothetical protein KGJ55_00795, partial [Gammaproteobacteria bacterium]|nr:hypothetical protein [Gammaproteobacteria bacterium]
MSASASMYIFICSIRAYRMNQKQKMEMSLTKLLFEAIGCSDIQLTPGDRPDVIGVIGDTRIGIEVTQFHSDETQDDGGSSRRAIEERKARSYGSRSYALNVTVDPLPGLVARIESKIATAAVFDKTS